ncbi:MAG: MFS transporter [Acidobacteria bacterium]|nr:MAG: MFS transporter [Acidobacteriota bacterium]
MPDPASSPDPPRFDPARRRAVTFALALISATAALEGTVVSTAMPTIVGDLQGLSLYSWVFSVFLLTSTVTMPLYGRLADIYGRRRVLLLATSLFLIGGLACAFARSMPQLVAARGLQGLGAGGLLPVAIAVVADLYALRERARIQALFSAIWGTASLIGPLLGAFLTLSLGWRSIFLVIVPLGLVSLALEATQMRESRASRPDPFDWVGGATLTAGVSALLLATLREAGSGGHTRPRLALIAVGVALLAAFARQQVRREHPLVPLTLLTHRDTAAPYLAGALVGTTIFGVDTFVPLFVQGARGGTAAAAGAVVTPIMFFWATSASLGTRALVRYGFRATAHVGSLLVTAGCAALLAAALAEARVAWISAACALIGMGLGPLATSQMLAVQHAAPESQRGVASSLVPFFRALGGALGVGTLGGLLSSGLDRHLGPAADVAGRLLAGRETVLPPGVTPLGVRHAIAGSLLPVFGVMLVLAIVNVAIVGRFPGRAHDPAEQVPRPAA